MRILLNTPPIDKQGGVANFYLVLRRHLTDDVSYFYIGRRGNEAWILTVFRLFIDYLRFASVLVRRGGEIVQLNPSLGGRAIWRDAVFLVIAKCLRKKVVVFLHGWDKEYQILVERRYPWLFRSLYFRADALVVLANEFDSLLRAMGYSGPVYIMTTAYDDSLLSQSEPGKSRENGDERFNILFISRIERKKGIFEALNALLLLQSRRRNVFMTIAGSGPVLDDARSYVRDMGILNVEFVGYVRGLQKAEVFSRAHCFLFPTSWGEGMPISVVEAMAFGVPVVTRPMGALADFFRDGEMGFLTESTDPAVFACLVERLIESPALCEKMSNYNREYAMKHFSAPSVAARLASIYRDVGNIGG